MAGEQHSIQLTESMVREIEEIADDSMFTRRVQTSNETTPGSVNEGASSVETTPNPLNTAFINEEEAAAATDVNDRRSQISLSQLNQQLSQTTQETSSTIHGLIGRILEQEEEQQCHPIIDLRTPAKTMISTGTMPRTPMMKSVGTMPMTPTMTSTGTMPRTPSSTTASALMTTTETIDLCSPSTPITTIDLRSPIVELIELSSSSPDTPTNAGSPNNPSRR